MTHPAVNCEALFRTFLFCFFQGWKFAHSLIAHLLICSDCSNQMSDCDQFDQISQDKWATVSESLRSLILKERPWANHSGCSWQMKESLVFWANCSFTHFLQKTSDLLRKPMSEFPALVFFQYSKCTNIIY